MLTPYYNIPDFTLYQGDSLELLKSINEPVDMIFADPPYFLSTGNGKVNINGKYIKFDKGNWDRVRTRDEKDEFNMKWLSSCCRLLKDNGTIWVCGTYHNIFSVERLLVDNGFKIINLVSWQKSNPREIVDGQHLTFSTDLLA